MKHLKALAPSAPGLIYASTKYIGDMLGLSKDAFILATGQGCPRQIVRYTPRVYGFQCHLEFNHEAVSGMIQHCGHEPVTNNPFIQSAKQMLKQDYQPINQLLFSFLDRLIKSR